MYVCTIIWHTRRDGGTDLSPPPSSSSSSANGYCTAKGSCSAFWQQNQKVTLIMSTLLNIELLQ